jgi:ATP-dependent DNA helicase RecQ
VRKLYGDIANFLQIDAGSGQDQLFAFDLAQFVKSFSWDAVLALNGIKVLEQQSLFAFNEQLFISAKVGFTTNKDTLENFEKIHPELEELIKTLLRNYPGVFDNPIAFSEKKLAWLVKQPVEQVEAQLQTLSHYRIVDYQPQKDQPHLIFLHNRVRTADLLLDQTAYQARKKAYTERLQKMIDWMETKQCRSRFIGNYFGDSNMKDCGICDNCLERRKQTALSKEAFDNIEQQIMHQAQTGHNAKTIVQSITGYPKTQIWQVLDVLVQEEKLTYNSEGTIKLFN